MSKDTAARKGLPGPWSDGKTESGKLIELLRIHSCERQGCNPITAGLTRTLPTVWLHDPEGCEFRPGPRTRASVPACLLTPSDLVFQSVESGGWFQPQACFCPLSWSLEEE